MMMASYVEDCVIEKRGLCSSVKRVKDIFVRQEDAMTLKECFDNHQGRPVGKIAHFFEVYEMHFARYCGTPVRMLEIGVHKGGSLELW